MCNNLSEGVLMENSSAKLGFHAFPSLEANLTAFCEVLRQKHGFKVGPGEVLDALRAVEVVGVDNQEHFQSVLRLVLTSMPQEVEVFDQAFRDFFLPEPGVAQENLNQPWQARAKPEPSKTQEERKTNQRPDPTQSDGETEDEIEGGLRQRNLLDEQDDLADTWRTMQARYSHLAAKGESAEVRTEELPEMLAIAGMLLRRLRLGRSRRYKPRPRGPRFDFRRTLRSSLQTGGEPFHFHWLGHPLRNPRMLVIVDGSRSMQEHSSLMLQFAYALAQCTRRLDVFVFSTALHDVTKKLRSSRGEAVHITDLAQAWGGGTRIGECLERLLKEHGHRCLSDNTLVMILSDGLDLGEPQRLRQAMHEVQRRAAGVLWLNPLLGQPGYEPSAQGMRAALPFVDGFYSAHQVSDFRHIALNFRLD